MAAEVGISGHDLALKYSGLLPEESPVVWGPAIPPGLARCPWRCGKAGGGVSAGRHFPWAAGSMDIHGRRNGACPERPPGGRADAETGLSCASGTGQTCESQGLGNVFL